MSARVTLTNSASIPIRIMVTGRTPARNISEKAPRCRQNGRPLRCDLALLVSSYGEQDTHEHT